MCLEAEIEVTEDLIARARRLREAFQSFGDTEFWGESFGDIIFIS